MPVISLDIWQQDEINPRAEERAPKKGAANNGSAT